MRSDGSSGATDIDSSLHPKIEATGLSKSLGSVHPHSSSVGLSRSSSEISRAVYSGFLLKRSNQPYLRSRPTAAIPVGDGDNDSKVLLQPQPAETRVDIQCVSPKQPDNTTKPKSRGTRPDKPMNMIAAFFGLADRFCEENTFDTDKGKQPVPTLQRSRPIVLKAGPGRQIHRHESAPQPIQGPPPVDSIEADGHIWRAKFCVLEEGVLYFYRNRSDAESADATLERLCSKRGISGNSFDNLSQSPLPRNLLGSGSEDSGNGTVMWEKRVSLDSVGAVRSSELEYGRHSFELLAPDESEGERPSSLAGTDSLVLRARNSEELNEWLFQFHRCIASFMRDIVKVVSNRWPAVPAADFPVLGHALDPGHPSTFNRSFQKQGLLSSSLSHGHGRSGIRRRKSREEDLSPWVPPQLPLEALAPFSLDSIETSTPAQPGVILDSWATPEVSGSSCPETERPVPTTPKNDKYVPPHIRNGSKNRQLSSQLRKTLKKNHNTFMSLQDRIDALPPNSLSMEDNNVTQEGDFSQDTNQLTQRSQWLIGGCADPSLAVGSILDQQYKKRLSSRVWKSRAVPYSVNGRTASMDWECGAVSECGVRETNEDSFLVCGDLFGVSNSADDAHVVAAASAGGGDAIAAFALFDGHCGNEAARYSAENLTRFLKQELVQRKSTSTPEQWSSVLTSAITKLDKEFCELCLKDGRTWESGTTALVAIVEHNSLAVSNVGDCRAVLCRSLEDGTDESSIDVLLRGGWALVDSDGDNHSWTFPAKGNCFWKEVTGVHTPGRGDERARVERANGWITTEQEIPIAQLQRMDFCDEDVVEILKRCFSERYDLDKKRCHAAPQRLLQIHRVCGELAVSRAIGDRDFKAEFNRPSNSSIDSEFWDCPLFLPYPDDHTRKFHGDLITAEPETQTMHLSSHRYVDEFLLLACDGLWDVMDPDDAVRVTRALLLTRAWSAKKAAARLAELAVHLGSSDNITVIVVSFQKKR